MDLFIATSVNHEDLKASPDTFQDYNFFLINSPKSFLFFILYLIVIEIYYSQADFLKNKYRETWKCLVNIKEKYRFLIIVSVFLLIVKKYARGWINMAFPKNCNNSDTYFITKTSAPTF